MEQHVYNINDISYRYEIINLLPFLMAEGCLKYLPIEPNLLIEWYIAMEALNKFTFHPSGEVPWILNSR